MTSRRTFRGSVLTLAAAAVLLSGARVGADDASPPPVLKVGEVVAAFDAQGVDGTLKRIGFTGRNSTVLLFFLSGCPTCHKMIPEWNRAFERKPAKLNVVGVLMDREPPGFFEATRIAFPVVRSPGRGFLEAWKVQRAPMTIRIGAGGKVEEAQIGIIDPIRLGEIFRP